jgi:hypothetical protein
MKVLLFLAVLAVIVLVVLAVRSARKRKQVKPVSTQERIVAHVQEHLDSEQFTGRKLRAQELSEESYADRYNRKHQPTYKSVAKPVTKSYEMKSRKNRENDSDVDFGYWDTDGGSTYTETGSHVESSKNYYPEVQSTHNYDAPSSSSSSDSSSSSSSSDSGGGGSSSSD